MRDRPVLQDGMQTVSSLQERSAQPHHEPHFQKLEDCRDAKDLLNVFRRRKRPVHELFKLIDQVLADGGRGGFLRLLLSTRRRLRRSFKK